MLSDRERQAAERERIEKLLKEGLTPAQIEARTGFHRRRILRVRQKLREKQTA